MRIIGGNLKRRQLPVNSKLPVRPTTDIAKEALFNILNNNFDFYLPAQEASLLSLPQEEP
jgi:16S rRNA (guanine966-N2)-methyltransferase